MHALTMLHNKKLDKNTKSVKFNLFQLIDQRAKRFNVFRNTLNFNYSETVCLRIKF